MTVVEGGGCGVPDVGEVPGCPVQPGRVQYEAQGGAAREDQVVHLARVYMSLHGVGECFWTQEWL